MTPAARALVCMLAVSACEGRHARLTTAGVSLGIGGYATYDLATRDSTPPVWLTAVAITGGLLGVLALLSGLDNEADRTPRSVVVHAPDRRDEAWHLTKNAQSAARAEDCNAVLKFSVVVRQIDPEFHATVFMRDVAIARCLADSVAAPQTTEPRAPY